MKKKLNLDKLKIDSFVTNIDKQHYETVKGGVRTSPPTVILCPVLTGSCDPVSNLECTIGCGETLDVFVCN
ncbi:MAG: pinensin family lanthipeptide [Cyclobacteriaceae bacterium]